MISEVNSALRAVLKPHLPARTAMEFGPQTEEHTGKGLTFFLYEMHEDPKGHGVMWSDVRDGEGTLVGRQPPARRFRLSYLVTAWGADGDQEAGLLDAALTALTRWEDASLANGPGSPESPHVLLAMEVAQVGVAREPWEILKAARVMARTPFDLVVVTEMVNDIWTDVPRPAEKIDLDTHDRPRSQLPPGRSDGILTGPSGKRWQRVPRDK